MCCSFCGSDVIREVWHKTDVIYIYEIQDNVPVKKAEIPDLCPGNGISVFCGSCGEYLFDGSIMTYLERIRK